MRKVIQQRVVQVIRHEVAEYYCDACGNRCGTRENPKETWYKAGTEKHYCKRGEGCHPGNRARNE